jgi:stage II sporulation protein AA (anti-sigma F factor antagonist)
MMKELYRPLKRGVIMQKKIYKLRGEIDDHASRRLSREIDSLISPDEPIELILDMSDVTLMDSSGIGLLLGRFKKIKRAGGRLKIAAPSKNADRILSLAGIYEIIKKAK